MIPNQMSGKEEDFFQQKKKGLEQKPAHSKYALIF